MIKLRDIIPGLPEKFRSPRDRNPGRGVARPARVNTRFPDKASSRRKIPPMVRLFLEYSLCVGGIFVLAWYVHGKGVAFLIAMAGLLVSSVTMALGLIRSEDPMHVLGLQKFSLHTLRLCLQFSAVGIAMVLLIRHNTGLSLFPGKLTRVALVAPLIGMTEELVFRGFVQGRLKSAGFFLSVVLASAGHAFYKFLVLESLPAGLASDLPWLALMTFLIGVVLGTFREITGTVVPAVVAHAAFDLFLYGDSLSMPVWVWG